MPVFEITQAGINSINDFDPDGNLPTGNFGYCNVYNVDPTAFDKDDFKLLETAAEQIAYLSSTSTGARDGYSAPPSFPYQGSAVALNRLGNSGSVVANQPAVKVNKVSASDTNYVYRLANGFGDYYFNLLVIYNTVGTAPASRDTDQNMPIAFIYLFDGMQFKSIGNEIEINAILQYAGLTATIEFVVNEVTVASMLEVTSPDLLPEPQNSSTNAILIRDPSPASTAVKSNASLAYLVNDDITGGGNNILLWQFETHQHYIQTTVASNGANSVTQTDLNDFTFNAANLEDAAEAGYFMQVVSGAFVGQCRRITAISNGNYIRWATAFGNPIPVGTQIRVYIPNRIYFKWPRIPSTQEIDYGYSLRARQSNITGYDYVYDGLGGNNLRHWPHTSLATVTNATNGDWYVDDSFTSRPYGLTSGTLNYSRNGGFATQQVTDHLTGNKWIRYLIVGSSAGDWLNVTDNFRIISNVSEIPSFPNSNGPVINKYVVSNKGAFSAGSGDSDRNSIIVSPASLTLGPHFFSFSTHSNFVASGSVSSISNSVTGQSSVGISVSVGQAINTWNLNTSISGEPLSRFIIQFSGIVSGVVRSGYVRGVAVADVNTGTSTVIVRPQIPNMTGAQFRIVECNLARQRVNAVADYDFQDLGPNSYSYTAPGGFIVKGGGPIPIPDGAGPFSFTFASLGHTPFPNKCFSVSFQADNQDVADVTRLISKTATAFTVRKNSNQDAFFYWEAKGI